MGYGALALVIAAGLVGPLVAAVGRFAPPVVVGELAAGVVLGRTGLDWVHGSDPLLSGLASIGFVLLMFVVGTHLPVRDPNLRAAAARGAGVAATVGAAAAIVGVALAPTVSLHRPAVLAVLIAASSGAVALPVLQSLPADRTVVVTTAWIALADVATVLTLPFVLAVGSVPRALLGGVLVLLSGAALYVALSSARDSPAVRRLRHLSHDRGWGVDLRVSLLALFVAAWIATRFGTSILVAGFAMGAAVAFVGEPRRVAQQLVGLGEGFAIPVFFVHLGAQLDLRGLLHSPSALRLAVVIAAASLVVHVLASLAWRLPVASGLLSSAQLGVPSAVATIGLQTKQLTATDAAAVMASVLVTLAACALGAALLGNRGQLPDLTAPHPT
ncbi:MAG TPA: cation:proton antiporter [Acidimicrobiales bacterium]|nr:cation:proton antiporter [Acidimicrobiales bacterium]